MTDLLQSLSKIKGRWMVGGSGIDVVPAEIRTSLAAVDQPVLALLAIAAQADQVAFRAAPAGALAPFPSLPKLDLPPLPDACRVLFRRFFTLHKLSDAQKSQLLHFMALRGFTTHPADYMPDRFDDLPACYAPWDNWHERDRELAADTLSEQTWDDFLPAERGHALAALRLKAPKDALQLVEAKADSLPAEQRLKCVAALAAGLSKSDSTYLEKLYHKDRSSKVQALAGALLARLGGILDETENAAELADFHELAKKGLINRKTIVKVRKLKTGAQQARRTELFETVSVPGFAAALGLTAETLVSSWNFGNDRADYEFSCQVARTGSEAAINVLTDRIVSEVSARAGLLQPLLDRLPVADRWRHLPEILRQARDSLDGVLFCAEGNFGCLDGETLVAAPAVKTLLKSVKSEANDDGKSVDPTGRQHMLFQLGLIADQHAAQNLIQLFLEAGKSRTDASLLMLQFNAALTPGDPL